MRTLTIETPIKVYTYHELSAEEQKLTESALEATHRSYAPYSNFHVGAAVLLENDVIVTGTNQENVAYPSGLCAERTALFYANSQYPDVAIKALAIVGCSQHEGMNHTPISPCGACRQVMIETEKRFGKPIKFCSAVQRKCMYAKVHPAYCPCPLIFSAQRALNLIKMMIYHLKNAIFVPR